MAKCEIHSREGELPALFRGRSLRLPLKGEAQAHGACLVAPHFSQRALALDSKLGGPRKR